MPGAGAAPNANRSAIFRPRYKWDFRTLGHCNRSADRKARSGTLAKDLLVGPRRGQAQAQDSGEQDLHDGPTGARMTRGGDSTGPAAIYTIGPAAGASRTRSIENAVFPRCAHADPRAPARPRQINTLPDILLRPAASGLWAPHVSWLAAASVPKSLGCSRRTDVDLGSNRAQRLREGPRREVTNPASERVTHTPGLV